MKNRLVARIAMIVTVCAVPLALAACNNTTDMATFCRDARTMENHFKPIEKDGAEGVTPAVMDSVGQTIAHLADEAPPAIKGQMAELGRGLQSYAAGRLDDPALRSAGKTGDNVDRYLSAHCNIN